MSEYRELLIGCGSRRDKLIHPEGQDGWTNLTTLDINPDHHPDVVWNLELLGRPGKPDRSPFPDDTFDEIHAYEVLEHLGQQGDDRAFFEHFTGLWRWLKPGGLLFATCPSYRGMWAWGDPSHKRVITAGTLVFLSQAEYTKQVGVTPMSDFRHIYKADFKIEYAKDNGEQLSFCLRAIK